MNNSERLKVGCRRTGVAVIVIFLFLWMFTFDLTGINMLTWSVGLLTVYTFISNHIKNTIGDISNGDDRYLGYNLRSWKLYRKWWVRVLGLLPVKIIGWLLISIAAICYTLDLIRNNKLEASNFNHMICFLGNFVLSTLKNFDEKCYPFLCRFWFAIFIVIVIVIVGSTIDIMDSIIKDFVYNNVYEKTDNNYVKQSIRDYIKDSHNPFNYIYLSDIESRIVNVIDSAKNKTTSFSEFLEFIMLAFDYKNEERSINRYCKNTYRMMRRNSSKLKKIEHKFETLDTYYSVKWSKFYTIVNETKDDSNKSRSDVIIFFVKRAHRDIQKLIEIRDKAWGEYSELYKKVFCDKEKIYASAYGSNAGKWGYKHKNRNVDKILEVIYKILDSDKFYSYPITPDSIDYLIQIEKMCKDNFNGVANTKEEITSKLSYGRSFRELLMEKSTEAPVFDNEQNVRLLDSLYENEMDYPPLILKFLKSQSWDKELLSTALKRKRVHEIIAFLICRLWYDIDISKIDIEEVTCWSNIIIEKWNSYNRVSLGLLDNRVSSDSLDIYIAKDDTIEKVLQSLNDILNDKYRISVLNNHDEKNVSSILKSMSQDFTGEDYKEFQKRHFSYKDEFIRYLFIRKIVTGENNLDLNSFDRMQLSDLKEIIDSTEGVISIPNLDSIIFVKEPMSQK